MSVCSLVTCKDVMFLSNGAVAGAMMGCKFGFKKLPVDLLQFPHRSWLDRKVHQFLVTIGLADQQQSGGQDEKEDGTKDQAGTVDQTARDDDQGEAKDHSADAGDNQNDSTQNENQDTTANQDEKVVDKDPSKDQDVNHDTAPPDQTQDATTDHSNEESMGHSTTASSSAE